MMNYINITSGKKLKIFIGKAVVFIPKKNEKS